MKMPFQRVSRKYGSGCTGYKRTRNAPPPRISYKRRRITGGTTMALQAVRGVARLTRMIETKEAQRVSNINIGLAHNESNVINDTVSGQLNPFAITQGSSDPMSQNTGNRIGDSIAVKGMTIKAFIENALGRSRVYYRLLLLKCAKGDVPTRSVLFKNDSNNKMMDVINTERFTIMAQKIFNIDTTNAAPLTVGVNGVPSSGTPAGPGTKLVTMWIPGRKFGRNGVVQYLSDSTSDLKFFDYRITIVAYDWYGTPQDISTVGRVNELFTKLYYKDA